MFGRWRIGVAAGGEGTKNTNLGGLPKVGSARGICEKMCGEGTGRCDITVSGCVISPIMFCIFVKIIYIKPII